MDSIRRLIWVSDSPIGQPFVRQFQIFRRRVVGLLILGAIVMAGLAGSIGIVMLMQP